MMPRLGPPRIMSIAIAAIAGGLGQIAVQCFPLRREGFRYSRSLSFHDEGLGRVLLLMGSDTLGLAATAVNLFVNTLWATGQWTGADSRPQYAFRLMYFPMDLFGVSIATAVLPAVSRHAALNDATAIRGTVVRHVCRGRHERRLLLRRELDGIEGGALAAFTHIAAAAAMMTAGALAVDRAAAMVLPGRGTPAQAARLATSIARALAVLVGAAKLLGAREFEEALGQLVGARDTI